MRASGNRSNLTWKNSASSPGDGRNHQQFVAFLKAVVLIAQEADVFLVYIDINEAEDLPVLAAQLLAQGRKTDRDGLTARTSLPLIHLDQRIARNQISIS